MRIDRTERLFFAVLAPDRSLLAGDPQLLEPTLPQPDGGALVFSQQWLGPTVRLVQLAAPAARRARCAWPRR